MRARRADAYERARPEVQDLVPRSARRVLDLGCASGALGAALKRRQEVEVVGVEVEPSYADDARQRLDRVVDVDVEELFQDEARGAELGPFDCIVAADVLEHLRDPWTALRCAAGLLEPGGTAVVSLPNVRHWEVLMEVGLRGRWPTRDSGIFDATHLRWFTRRDAHELLRGAGLAPVETRARYRLLAKETRLDAPLEQAMAATPLRELFAFQYVFAARRGD